MINSPRFLGKPINSNDNSLSYLLDESRKKRQLKKAMEKAN